MKERKGWVLLALATWLVSASGWGTECRFFRIECLDGEAPENLAITMDESGQTFLEFDTVEGKSYSIEATDSLSPPVWGAVWTLTGDGQRATWLTTSRRWSKTFGGSASDYAYSVQETSDGGYIVAGETGGNVYLIKTDANGDAGKRGWTKTFGGTGDDRAYCVQQTTDGGYIVAGVTYSFGAGDYDAYLIKTDQNGDEVWSRTFGGTGWDEAWSVQQTTDGGYIVAGYTMSFGAGPSDVYLIKTDANGNEVWSRTFGGSSYEVANSVQQTTDGGYIVAGMTYSFGAGLRDVYLIKTDANGDEVWSSTFGGSGHDYGYSVQQTTDGGYILAGRTNSFAGPDHDAYLIKTEANGLIGKRGWSRTFGGTEYEEAWSVQQTTDGGYIVAGTTLSFGAGQDDAYLVKTDANGDEVWSRTFGGSRPDQAYAVQQTSDGGYIVAGQTYSFGEGEFDVYLIKTDANGNAPPPK